MVDDRPRLLGRDDRQELGDDPPQRSIIGEWLNWRDSAGSPHSGLRNPRVPQAPIRLTLEPREVPWRTFDIAFVGLAEFCSEIGLLTLYYTDVKNGGEKCSGDQ